MARKVTPNERKLWNKVAATTSRGMDGVAEPIGEQPVKTGPKATGYTPQKFEIGSTAKTAAAPIANKQPPSPIDAKALAKLRRGRSTPEAKIDLHGLTQAEALPALIQFIHRAVQRNFRMVLVITGKGKERPSIGPIPERTGVLKQSLPMWLARPPLNSLVQGSVQSHQKHGGSGAFYVYLKRSRK